MISNERTFGYGRRPPVRCPKTSVQESILTREQIQIERKTFVFTLKENPRGCFLRITEDVGGRFNSIVIPAPGLAKFREVLEHVMGIVSLGNEQAESPADSVGEA